MDITAIILFLNMNQMEPDIRKISFPWPQRQTQHHYSRWTSDKDLVLYYWSLYLRQVILSSLPLPILHHTSVHVLLYCKHTMKLPSIFVFSCGQAVIIHYSMFWGCVFLELIGTVQIINKRRRGWYFKAIVKADAVG